MEALWLSPPKKFMRVHSAGKVMASIFWDSQGAIMIDYLEQGRTINGAYYAGELRRYARQLTRGVVLLQDTDPAHTSQLAMTAATECGFEILPHPPYSPDMAPLPKTEIPSSWYTVWKQLRCHRGSKRVLGGQGKAFYFEGIRQLEQRLATCIALKGDYIEK